ncbi:MAG: hypothetical protein B7Z70_13610 [Acidithiobacillus ferrivorans]|uniref:50S ribosomal protein L3 n=1 Tax=Acidithiobacillus ferrivorans TaxID=160808 RepID=A0A257SJC7_9PROT|nr:MAG: hypothetical protein B7Z70_13610 [Acidithiobacillus ferrivorans]
MPLPTKIERFTVLRSPHVDKNARDQFEQRTHKRLLDILDPNDKTVDALIKLEFRVADTTTYACGADIDLDIFVEGQRVDVSGVSKGKGFAGAIKRHNFRSNRASHGNSRAHNAPGSIGCRQTPGRVFKGKKMAGHLGAEQVTTLNLELVRIDANRRLLMIKGAVPGARDGDVIVRPAVRG